MQLQSGSWDVQQPQQAPLRLHAASHGFPISRTEQKLLQGIQHLPVVQYFLLRQEGEQILPPQIPESINTNRSYGVSI